MRKQPEPFFSIIIPVYNVDKYLEDCLNSILEQNYTNYEIICIDDASTDNSINILKKYSEKYQCIQVMYNEFNKGLSYSRNRGIDVAKGQYIWFVDSDDMISNNALSILYNILKKYSVDILYIGYKKIVDNKEYSITSNELKTNTVMSGLEMFVQFHKVSNWKIMACGQLIKRGFINKNRLKFYDGIYHEDVLFSFESIIKAKKVMNIKEELYLYRIRGGSITSCYTTERLDSMVIVFCEIFKLWNKINCSEEENEAIKEYLNARVEEIYKYSDAFPKHEMNIGSPMDKYMFSVLCKGIYRNTLDDADIVRLQKSNMVIIYGAGIRGTEILRYLNYNNIKVSYYAITNKDEEKKTIRNIPVCQIDDLIKYKDSASVVIAVDKKYRDEIKINLVRLGFKKYYDIVYEQ